ncbi:MULTISPECIES: DUF397 domain-containing protein [unclassified Actinopolyspora]|uniref:DUF397 domain-containing protein n=1 Tax=unclassified Actinopolyspora TaxID=2639451 RepID=UPI0013F612F9|nr:MULTISPECIES: DUF397 domain-containing protein [unclassified Actinopolyspora]NHD16659.1 DUF397 domain-containing protein [Actinopolyspora sp. BKK2]NHE75478.1 DUF397 domain-containing protein [Actinopolyspora sp. BKK1]
MTTRVEGWRKASYSSRETDCVEVGRLSDGAAVRDTKNRAAGHLTTTAQQWAAFITAVKAERFG